MEIIRPPGGGGSLTPHHGTHENGGSDQINVAGLSGELADAQTPKTHASTHENGGSDEMDVTDLSGVLADPQHPIRSAQTIIVAISGGDFTSLGNAVSSIIDASNTKPYIVIVESGVYTESFMTIPSFVKVIGRDNNATIVASSATAPIFSMSSNTSLTGLTIAGPASDVTIEIPTQSRVDLDKLAFIAGQTAIRYGSSDGRVTNCVATSGVTNFLLVEDGSTVSASDLLSYAQVSYRSDNATLWIHNSGIGAGMFGISAISGGTIYPSNVTANNCAYVVHTGMMGSNTIIGNGVVSRGMSNFDVFQENPSSSISLTGCSLDGQKIQAQDFTKINLQFSSRTEGQEVLVSTVSGSFGIPEHGEELQAGEGGGTSRGIRVYEYTASTSTFVNATAAAKSTTGSTFGIPGTNVDDALYISWDLNDNDLSDKKKFFGIRLDITQAAVLGAGEIVIEAWNGSGWIWINTMSAQETGKKLPFTNYEIFQRTGLEAIRFDGRLDSQWVKNDPASMGIDQYWIRFRVATAISTQPVFEYLNIFPSHTHIGHDGWMNFHGKARPNKTISWDIGLLQAVAPSPANRDVYLSDTLAVGRIENYFQAGQQGRIGMNTYLPFDIDTSCPILFRWVFLGTDNSTGTTVDWVVRWGWSADSDGVYPGTSAPSTGPNEQSISISTNLTTRRIQYSEVVELDISEMKSRRSAGNGDIFWLSIQRSGDTDTYGGNVAMINVSPVYKAWNLGGHE